MVNSRDPQHFHPSFRLQKKKRSLQRDGKNSGPSYYMKTLLGSYVGIAYTDDAASFVINQAVQSEIRQDESRDKDPVANLIIEGCQTCDGTRPVIGNDAVFMSVWATGKRRHNKRRSITASGLLTNNQQLVQIPYTQVCL